MTTRMMRVNRVLFFSFFTAGAPRYSLLVDAERATDARVREV